VAHLEIKTDGALRDYCRELAQSSLIGFDTEFVAEYSYRPKLCLVQVVDEQGKMAMIDSIAVDDMAPFWEVVANGREVVVHAGRGEMEFCLRSVGRLPAKIFDVQIAAGLAGIEYPASYNTLITKVLGARPGKHETRTDWRRRPLSARQIAYAMEDVVHLRPLRDALVKRLESLDRLPWVEEEMATWLAEVNRSLTQERWRRVSGNSGLDRRALAVLRELWRWREKVAERRDKPVRHVLRDDLMVELAKRKTADTKRIGSVRGLERGDLRRHLGDISKHIQRALDLPEDKCPTKFGPKKTPPMSVLGQFLFAALGSVCREQSLAPNLVGSPTDVRELISHQLHGKPERPPALAQGWRAEVVGRLFEDLLSGKTTVRVTDPDSDYPLAFDRS
jgi:ribonuclease D